MKLIVQIKLVPTAVEAVALHETMVTVNSACNRLSQLAWDAGEFRRFPLQKMFYRQLRNGFPLSSQAVIRLIAKTADAYIPDHKTKRSFNVLGSISYDCRILDIKVPCSTISIWTVNGRLKHIPFICGEKQRMLLSYPIGESYLILRDGQWYLYVTVDVPEEKEREAVDVLGIDLGIVEIAYDSDGTHYSGSKLNKIRNRNRSLRRKLQKIATKSAKRLLKKRSKKESRFAGDTNHVISKRIVQTAKRTNRAIAIEELKGIRMRIRARKRERTRLHSWSFNQLGRFLTYKAALNGVPIIRVDPRNTSRQCSKCGHIAKTNRKSQSEFVCKKCGHATNADGNGAQNIRLRGLDLLGAGAFIRPNVEVISHAN